MGFQCLFGLCWPLGEGGFRPSTCVSASTLSHRWSTKHAPARCHRDDAFDVRQALLCKGMRHPPLWGYLHLGEPLKWHFRAGGTLEALHPAIAGLALSWSWRPHAAEAQRTIGMVCREQSLSTFPARKRCWVPSLPRERRDRPPNGPKPGHLKTCSFGIIWNQID